MSFTAKDVQNLRQASGAGMMDAKRALEETDGDFDAAAKLLREKGLAKSVDRADRENTQGVVAVASGAGVGRHRRAQVRDRLRRQERRLHRRRPAARRHRRRAAARSTTTRTAIDDFKVTLKENIEVGRVERVEVADGQAVDTYLHKQDGRGVNAVIVVLDGGDAGAGPRGRRVAPPSASRSTSPATRCPQADAAEERATLEGITRAEGKPEQAIEKIVEGRLNAWYKDQVLLEQPYAKDDKQSITQLLGDAKIARFAQVYIGS